MTEHELEFMELFSHLITLSNVFCEHAKNTPDIDMDTLNELVILNDYVQRIVEVISCYKFKE